MPSSHAILISPRTGRPFSKPISDFRVLHPSNVFPTNRDPILVVTYLTELPKTISGKIRRIDLRDMV
jgi:hypothetical protein